MGYINTATTTTLTAKLTPKGRQKLILTNNNLISYFSLGDSDANYYASSALGTGEVPTDGGDNGPYATLTNSVGPNVTLKSVLIVNKNGDLKKMVEPQSSEVTIQMVSNGTQTATAGSSDTINRNDLTTDPLVNLYYSFNLPLTSNDDYKFTGVTSEKGGYSNTALSGLAQTNILVIGIDNTMYGEVIDGKTIQTVISGATSAFTIYSTFQNTGQQLSILDANYNDQSPSAKLFGDNIAFLVSDDIMKPNGGSASLSWATGYNTTKPFSINNKQTFNLTTNTNLGLTADTLVGIAYLDKGFLVITDQNIVNDFTGALSSTTITCDSLSTSVIQNVTCLANRGEFGGSTNRTFVPSDTPRISEVGLYDSEGDLIAIAKTDRQIIKNVNDFLALGIKFQI